MVEDQILFRSGLKRLLEAELDEVKITETSSARSALEALSEQTFDLVTTDLSLPQYDGLWLIQRLRHDGCRLPILVLTNHKSPRTVSRSLSLGADGYLLKSAEPEQFLVAIESVASGRQYIDSRLQPDNDEDTPSLSLNAIELLNHLRAGMKPELVRRSLKLSPPTFQSLSRSLCRKLDSENLQQALARALSLGLLVSEKHS